MSISYILDENAQNWATIYAKSLNCSAMDAESADITNMNVSNFSANTLEVISLNASNVFATNISTGATGTFSSGSATISNLNVVKIVTNLNTNTGVNRNNLVVYTHDNLAPLSVDTILTAQDLINGFVSIDPGTTASFELTLPTAVQLTSAIGPSAMDAGSYFKFNVSNNSTFIIYILNSTDGTIFCRDVPGPTRRIPIQPNSSRTVAIYKKSNSFYICI